MTYEPYLVRVPHHVVRECPAELVSPGPRLRSDTPARLALTPVLTRHDVHMAKGANAGIKRDRGPAGVPTVTRDVGLKAERWAEFDSARGNASRGMYVNFLMQLAKQANGGVLPEFSPALYDVKEAKTTAA